MKLKITPDKISFRLDMAELEQLLSDGEIRAETPLPTGTFSYQVICLPPKSEASFKTSNMSFTLSLPWDVIEGHKAELPSLKGIVTEFATAEGKISAALEINLKKKLKRSMLS